MATNKNSVPIYSHSVRETHVEIDVTELPLTMEESDAETLVVWLTLHRDNRRPIRRSIRLPMADVKAEADRRFR